MGKLLIATGISALLAAAACQPLYSTRAEPIKNPKVIVDKNKSKSGTPDPVAAAPKQQIDDCEWHVKPLAGKGTTAAKRDTVQADATIKRGDMVSGKFDKEPNASAKGELLIDSIQAYGNALDKDPYSAEATLKLAVAYDKAQRRGCALALLDRLKKLSNHPTYQTAANGQIDEIDNHKAWFGDYRKEAMQKVGR